jgi:DNA primase catalytic core
MQKTPEETIQQLKNIPLTTLAAHYNIQLKPHGKDLIGLCLWHDDHDPSFVISPDKNLWHCLGACNAGGSSIDLVMKAENLAFNQAVEWMSQRYLSEEAKPNSEVKQAEKEAAKKENNEDSSYYLAANMTTAEVLNYVNAWYHKNIKDSKEAKRYLKTRGLNNDKLIKTFQIGYCCRSLGYQLPVKNSGEYQAVYQQLKKIGILRESGHESFAGSITIPIFNQNNDVVEMYARKTGRAFRPGTPLHLYLKGSHQGVWNTQGLKNQKTIILCESLIDAMSFWIHGFTAVTSSYGTSGFTDDLMNLLIDYQIETVLIAYDRDEAGDNGAKKCSNQLIKHGIKSKRILLPLADDVNSYMLKSPQQKKCLQLIIDNAVAYQAETKAPQAFAEKTKSPLKINKLSDVKVSKKTSQSIKKSDSDSHSSINLEIPLLQQDGSLYYFDLGQRSYRIKGLNTKDNDLKINLLLTYENASYTDRIDLYSAKRRQNFVLEASEELKITPDIIKKDLGKLLLSLENEQNNLRQSIVNENEVPTINEVDKERALTLLRSPNLMKQLQKDLNKLGIVNESDNLLAGFLICTSRILPKPLGVIIQSTSAAGKSALMNAVLSLFPEHEKLVFSAMTGQSLFYMSRHRLQHKILSIAEVEGSQYAIYSIKILQSEGRLSIAAPNKDPDSGQMETQDHIVEGPVAVMSTNASLEVDDEYMNRNLLLSINESQAQTRLIHDIQRKSRTLSGFVDDSEKDEIIKIYCNAQQLLKRVKIMNPYAEQLKFTVRTTRHRRDNDKYLTIIDTIALLHQYQRKLEAHKDERGNTKEYIRVYASDIKLANELAHQILGRTLDELPPQTRNLLNSILEMVLKRCQEDAILQMDYRFNRRAIREYTGWSDSQLKLHCKRLEDYEYLLPHRGRRGLSYEYELLYDNKDGKACHCMGLLDINDLKLNDFDTNKLGLEGQ